MTVVKLGILSAIMGLTYLTGFNHGYNSGYTWGETYTKIQYRIP